MDQISGNVTTTVSFACADTGVPVINQVSTNLSLTAQTAYTYGKGQLKVNEAVPIVGTANATPVVINLYGDLTNIFNQQARFTSVKEVIIRNLETESGRVLTVGNASSTPHSLGMGAGTYTMAIGPGGQRRISEPIDGMLAGENANLIKLDPGAKSIQYEIIIVGENANL